jgi:hypothetical protein
VNAAGRGTRSAVRDAEIRYRVGWRQVPWYLPLFFVPQATLGHWHLFWIGLLVLFVPELLWLKRTGIDLTPDALVLRGIRRRVLPWSEITSMRIVPQLGQQAIVVTTRDEQRRLRAPVHTPFLGPDRDFRAKADTLYRYWVEHRGGDWAPVPPAWSAPWATSAGS